VRLHGGGASIVGDGSALKVGAIRASAVRFRGIHLSVLGTIRAVIQDREGGSRRILHGRRRMTRLSWIRDTEWTWLLLLLLLKRGGAPPMSRESMRQFRLGCRTPESWWRPCSRYSTSPASSCLCRGRPKVSMVKLLLLLLVLVLMILAVTLVLIL